ncbi:hypothetical protein CYMTET_37118 [Cymbomonas tetramitiformis]|uniref:Uncharacterized protein n=1 Tax=Cymbomonas tetramitiformis TaxID=36881 RepID=A0AAE0CEM2_9CHLO|nr:hypothetical protein CYMTET_37118 [Cymbomonas tetramitiformis]
MPRLLLLPLTRLRLSLGWATFAALDAPPAPAVLGSIAPPAGGGIEAAGSWLSPEPPLDLLGRISIEWFWISLFHLGFIRSTMVGFILQSTVYIFFDQHRLRTGLGYLQSLLVVLLTRLGLVVLTSFLN